MWVYQGRMSCRPATSFTNGLAAGALNATGPAIAVQNRVAAASSSALAGAVAGAATNPPVKRKPARVAGAVTTVTKRLPA